MEANRGQNGIQNLLAAEQEAQHIVNAAKRSKLNRLKQAKEEAEREIAESRAQMEAEFQRKHVEATGDSTVIAKHLEQETAVKISQLKMEAAGKYEDIVLMLSKRATHVTN